MKTRQYVEPTILYDPKWNAVLIWGQEYEENPVNVKVRVCDQPYWDRMALDDGVEDEIPNISAVYLALHARRKYLKK